MVGLMVSAKAPRLVSGIQTVFQAYSYYWQEVAV